VGGGRGRVEVGGGMDGWEIVGEYEGEQSLSLDGPSKKAIK